MQFFLHVLPTHPTRKWRLCPSSRRRHYCCGPTGRTVGGGRARPSGAQPAGGAGCGGGGVCGGGGGQQRHHPLRPARSGPALRTEKKRQGER